MNRVYEFGEYRLDGNSRILQRSGTVIPLTPKCWELLLLLVENPGRAVARDELLRSLWSDSLVEEANLSFQISCLRKALGDAGAKYIETLPRHGYRFACPVRQIAPASHAAASAESIAPPVASDVKPPKTVAFRPVSWQWYALFVVLIVTLVFSLWFFHGGSFPRGGNAEIVPLPITSYPGFQREPSLSPDGTQVAFSWDGPARDNFDIYLKLVGEGEPLRLTKDPAADRSPAWAPDGHSIAFLRYFNDASAGIYLIPALGGRERKIADVAVPVTALDGISNLAWSPDGKHLVLSCVLPGFPTSVICSVSAESGEMRRLTACAPGIGAFSPTVSPDGLSVAFIRFTGANGDVYVQSLNRDFTPRGESRRLTFVSTSVLGVAWTSNGADILFSAGPFCGLSGIRVARFRTNWMRQASVPTRTPFGENAVALSASGSGKVVYARAFEDPNIWRTELSSKGAREPSLLVSSTMIDATPDYSPNGKQIAFSSTRSGYDELWLADSDGSHPIQLTNKRMPNTSNPRWSPDGKKILFNALNPDQSDLYIIEVSTGVIKRLTETKADEVETRWSRDGRWIFYSSNKTGRFELYKMAAEGEGHPLQITRQGGLNPVISPDGRFLYYARNGDSPTSLWRVPIEGGIEEKLLDGLSYSLNFVVSEGRVYLLSLGDKPETSVLELYDLKTRIRKRLLSLNKGWYYGMALSPDRHWLSYTVADSQGSNLMLAQYPE